MIQWSEHCCFFGYGKSFFCIYTESINFFYGKLSIKMKLLVLDRYVMPKLSIALIPRISGDDRFLNTVTVYITDLPFHFIGKRYTASGIWAIPDARLASRWLKINLVGLFSIGISLSFGMTYRKSLDLYQTTNFPHYRLWFNFY